MAASNFATTKHVHFLKAKVAKLDRIFNAAGEASWWAAFRQGIFDFWLPTFFSNDEVQLWKLVNARITDILDGSLTSVTERSAELKKRLTNLEAQLKETQRQSVAADHDKKVIEHMFEERRGMPPRLKRMDDEQHGLSPSTDFTQTLKTTN